MQFPPSILGFLHIFPPHICFPCGFPLRIPPPLHVVKRFPCAKSFDSPSIPILHVASHSPACSLNRRPAIFAGFALPFHAVASHICQQRLLLPRVPAQSLVHGPPQLWFSNEAHPQTNLSASSSSDRPISDTTEDQHKRSTTTG